MLPGYIIEELLERERHQQAPDRREQPVVEMPVPEPPRTQPVGHDEPERGVEIIPLVG
jgi:hypothetical protein